MKTDISEQTKFQENSEIQNSEESSSSISSPQSTEGEKSSHEKKYWLDLKDLSGDKEFKDSVQREFLNPLPSEKEAGSSRREFLQLMGAGLALTAEGCFRRPTEKIVPYIKRPEDVIPGEANFYASSYYDGGEGFSILVKTREGRPIKIEGNGEASLLNGAGLSPRAQAHILSLYDPQRIKGPKRNLFNDKKTNRETVNVSWEAADQAVQAELKKGQVALLTSRIPSPSFKALVQDFKKSFSVSYFIWDPLSLEEAVEGQKASYGTGDIPSYNFSKAKFIFSLNCDFLGTYLSPAEFQRQFSHSRHPTDGMSRLVVLESLMSLTGSNGDERYRIRPSDQKTVLMALVSALQKKGISLPEDISSLIKKNESDWKALSIPEEKWGEWAEALIKYRGQSLILFGGVRGETEESTKALHIAMNFLNSVLGNDGKTVNYSQSFPGPFGSGKDMEKLISGLEEGRIKRVIIHKVNPLYAWPHQKRLEAALRKADLVVYTGDRVDETGLYADYILPDSHDLEKWGDWEFKKGVFSIGQPAIRPLYNTRAFEDSLLTWIKSSNTSVKAKNFYHYVKNRWTAGRGVNFWNQFLAKGVTGIESVSLSSPRVFRSSAWQQVRSAWKKKVEGLRVTAADNFFKDLGFKEGDVVQKVNGKWVNTPQASLKAFKELKGLDNFDMVIQRDGKTIRQNYNVADLQNGKIKLTDREQDSSEKNPHSALYELVLYETSGLRQGDLSNVPWLMEFPDPVTKICWDNYLCISPAEAVKRDIKEGQVVSIGEKMDIPVHIQPGQSEGVLGLALGFGRTHVGSIGNGVGVNAWPLLEQSHKVSFKKTGQIIPLANVQGHHSMEGRDIVLETTLKEFLHNPSSGLPKHHKVKSLWPSHKYEGHKWGMVIDLNSCTGCGTCILACQSENNIPTVGKKYVLEGREMHWIRVDRYYEGSPESPRTVHQPVVCMHCDNAPCETVCPVLATVHSSEGINDMVYNRCVGTRYCSNNCPYKVRRFNWFNYAKKIEEPLNMALNPDVTVRSRGVMEKCSFCIQRIHQAKGEAKREDRPLKDGELQTACQQSCPAKAITFGDLNDSNSQVQKEFKSKNSYALLDDHLNTKPSVKYKTKIRNIKGQLPSAEKGGH